MVSFLLIIGCIYLYIQVAQLKKRVDGLEKPARNIVQSIHPANTAPAQRTEAHIPITERHETVVVSNLAVAQTTPSHNTSMTVPVAPVEPGLVSDATAWSTPQQPSIPTIPTPVPEPFFVYTWFKDQPLIKIGALIFFLGTAWFVSYAIAEGWIAPVVRIMLGFGIATVFYSVGIWRRHTETNQYLVLTALGTGITFATVFAAQFLFFLFSPAVALTILVLSIAYTLYVAITTKTEWMAITAAIAGLIAPLLIEAQTTDQTTFMIYLLALSAAFLFACAYTPWRTLTLVFILGVGSYLLQASVLMSPVALFQFTCLFSLVFLASITLNLHRSHTPEPIDISSLMLAGGLYAYIAHGLAIFDGLALFIAAVLLAVVGYIMYERYHLPRIAAVYACTASAAVLIGTSYLLSGYSLLIALTCEITLAFVTLLYLKLSVRALYISAATFLIPLTAALPVLGSPAWQTGIFHTPAVATALLCVALWIASIYGLKTAAGYGNDRIHQLAKWLGVVAFVYTYVFLAVVGNALYIPGNSQGIVPTFTLWSLFSLIGLLLCLRLPLLRVFFSSICWSFVIAGVASLPSLLSYQWSEGIMSVDAIGAYMTQLTLISVTLLVYQAYRESSMPQYRRIGNWFAIGSIAYFVILVPMFFGALLPTMSDASYVCTYVTYALTVYGLISSTWLRTNPFPTLYYVTGLGILPLVLSLNSLAMEAWDESILSMHAVGLYVVTSILWIIALRFYLQQHRQPEMYGRLEPLTHTCFVLAGMYSTALVWLMAHSLAAQADLAVTAALFVYTVTGLSLYLIGSRQKIKDVRYAGIALLVIVVLRLALVEVWTMEMLWRIVTFIGIGLLFMLAAVFEKTKDEIGR